MPVLWLDQSTSEIGNARLDNLLTTSCWIKTPAACYGHSLYPNMPADRPIEPKSGAWYQLWDNQHCCLAWSKEVFCKAEHTSASQRCWLLSACSAALGWHWTSMTDEINPGKSCVTRNRTKRWNQHCKLFWLNTDCAFWNGITVLLTYAGVSERLWLLYL